MKLSGNTVLITGGGAGIGLEVARQLHARGNKIVVTGRDKAKLDKAAAALPGTIAIVSDVSKASDIESLYARALTEFPDVNVLVNNAGIMKDIDLQDASKDLEGLTREIDINLTGAIRLVARFLPHLKTKPRAAIVNVTSGLAFVPLPLSPVYCATKAGLHSFTLSLRVQLKRTNVAVFELAPPATDTELLNHGDPEDLKGVSIMKTGEMVAAALKGMEKDVLEIRPGQANQLKFMSRVAPEFILKQLSRPVERMLAKRG